MRDYFEFETTQPFPYIHIRGVDEDSNDLKTATPSCWSGGKSFKAVGSFTVRCQWMLARANVNLVPDTVASDGGLTTKFRVSGYNGG